MTVLSKETLGHRLATWCGAASKATKVAVAEGAFAAGVFVYLLVFVHICWFAWSVLEGVFLAVCAWLIFPAI